MAFEELLVIVLLFLLHSRAATRRRARRRRASELRRLHYAVIETERQILLRASLAMSRRLLQGWRVDRALWTKRRSTVFFKTSSLAGMIRNSKAIFMSVVRHLSISLANCSLIFVKRNSCVVPFLLNSELQSLCDDWEPTLNTEL